MISRAMLRKWLSVGSVAILVTGFSCTRQPTGLMTVLDADAPTTKALKQVQLRVQRNGAPVFEQTYELSSTRLPASLLLLKQDSESTSDPVQIELDGLDENGKTVIERKAVLGFVDEKTKLLRLPLRQDCLGVLNCTDPSSTCDHGVCTSAVQDPAALPDFTTNDDALAPVDPGTGGAAGAGGVAGTGGTAGTAGTAGAGGTAGTGGSGGTGGTGPTQLSCIGLAADCGPTQSEDCCATATTIVGGETVYRFCDASGTDANDNGTGTTACSVSWPATVTTFRLDKYEVTVGRFRAFLNAYDAWRLAGHPAQGEGGDPNVSSVVTSWDSSWTPNLPASAAVFKDAAHLSGSASLQTWVEPAGVGTENKAINFVSWYEAAAFCLWDAGWLPTEAEWLYAAAGGQENRVYPWSNPPSDQTLDGTYANYAWQVAAVQAVGSYDLGRGRWGHEDLAGNLSEWTWDTEVGQFPGSQNNLCDNCAQDTAGVKVFHGGAATGSVLMLRTSARSSTAPETHALYLGFRCARTAP